MSIVFCGIGVGWRGVCCGCCGGVLVCGCRAGRMLGILGFCLLYLIMMMIIIMMMMNYTCW